MIQFRQQQDLFSEVTTVQLQCFDKVVKAPVKNNIQLVKERLFIDETFLIINTLFKQRKCNYQNAHYANVSETKLKAIDIISSILSSIENNLHTIRIKEYSEKMKYILQYFSLLQPGETSPFYKNFMPKYLTLKDLFEDKNKLQNLLS